MNISFIKSCFLALALASASFTAVFAANPIPPDPEVRIGTLDNGLTYYIRHNDTPAHQADFFIAQRVGSVNELDNQQGLAHFLEHMCFNGTEHFPENSLVSYLESIGVKFGENLNAYTSTDETVYNICNVPADNQAALDSCVLILSDWSGRITLDPKDIDAERGVIIGEMKQRSSAGSRILTALAPQIFPGSPYGVRMPIGKADVVNNFSPQTLREYYEKWYHPKNQAVVIVGDVDVDAMEASVKRHFADLKAGVDAQVSVTLPIADNEYPIAVVGSDPEQATDMVQLYHKITPLEPDEANTIARIRRDYMLALISNMLVERMDALENADCPWANLGVGVKPFLLANTCEVLMFRATAKDADNARRSLVAFETELRRAAIHGFTESELQRAMLTERSARDRALARADVESNTELARRYVSNFTRGTLIPSTRQKYKMMKGVERTTSLDRVNALMASLVDTTGRNRVSVIYARPADEQRLTAGVILADAAAIDNADIASFVDPFVNVAIMEETPVPGSIVAENDGPFGSKILTLSNGIKVYLRPSDDAPDEILIHAVSPGGFAMCYDPDKKGIFKVTDDVVAISGFGGHSSSDLRKMLAGHNVRSAVKIGNFNEELIAITSPADFSRALQVLYLKATAISRDDNAFAAYMANSRAKLENPNTSATFAMGDTIHSVVFNRHPLGEKLYLADLDKVDYDSVISLHRQRFANMSDFSYIITGNFNTDSIAGDICTYIASLPGDGSADIPGDIGYGFYSGPLRTMAFTHPMADNPQSITYSFLNGECPYDLRHVLLAQTFGNIVKNRLMAEVREKRGLTYSINSHCSVTAGFNGPHSPSRFIMPVYIKVTPGHEDEVTGVVNATIDNIIANGPTAEEVAKVTSYLSKNIIENRTANAYWETVIKVYDQFGVDMDTDYEAIVAGITSAAVQAFAKAYISPATRLHLRMLPQ